VKDSFYEKLEFVFNKFPKWHMKIFFGYFNVKVGREDILKLTKFYMKLVMTTEFE
jgi:hypothetical protein